ncbi:MAG: serine hydrolase [Rhodospirillales bacterium]|nr:serine hydrolase [Rhodospirillales bacterium]
MRGYVDRGEIGNVVTLLYRRGQRAHADQVGWLDGEARIPVAHNSIFRIASMTKPVVSVAALMLLEEGRLRLDDPVDRWLPELADRRVMCDSAGDIDDTYRSPRPITVLDLFTHRPGLVSQFTAGGQIGSAAAKLHIGNALLLTGTDPDEWLARLGALPLVYEPGTHFNYGFATDVLGFLVARIAGVGLEDFLRQRLFGPLGMVDTGFHVPQDKLARLSVAHMPDPTTGKPVMNDHPSASPWSKPKTVPSGSAGLVSTADDYAKFGLMLRDGRGPNGDRLLSRKTIELMTTDFLTAEQRGRLFLGFDMWSARGFGLGVSIVDNLAGQFNLGSVARYGWGGAFGTTWFNDPREDLTAVMMIQSLVGPLSPKIEADFVNLVYQAIDD